MADRALARARRQRDAARDDLLDARREIAEAYDEVEALHAELHRVREMRLAENYRLDNDRRAT
jgi:predicted  nucleic acid-binding Zn-ribbon protein